MKSFEYYTKTSAWAATLLTLGLLAGCGGGEWDTDANTGTDTPDAPTVTSTTPVNEAVGVTTSTAVNVTFNGAMDEASITGSSFTLTGPDSASVAGEVTYSVANMTATFVPANELEFDTTYSAAVTTSAQSETGQGLASDHQWSFTTVTDDTVSEPITPTETNPVEAGTGVCTNKSPSATFNEPLEPSTIVSPATTFTLAETANTFTVDGDVSLDESGTTATFTPAQALNPDLEYTATITTEVEDVNGNSLEEDLVWSFTTSDSFCQQTITLGATEPYGVLSNTGVTLGGGPDSTTGLRVDGNVGIFPAGACIGCDTTTVSGVIEIGTVTAEEAITALEAAYNEATNRTTNVCTLIDSGVLTTNPSAACGGNADGVYSPGLYWSGSSIAIPAGGTITLDGGNDNDAVFIFQSESTIDTIGGDTHMILQNGAQAKNVFWVAQSSATIGGTNSDFAGTILALIGVTVNTGTDMEGRALARGAEVVIQDEALVTVPTE
ncbi:Ig-like domain-containing protein [Marinimicrobium locisalis]|uniref:Ig-like domain-containing protein n=1 Tax=Marinimicrobium locisalis TaxID=546022 RepID=UPI00322222B6